MKKHGLQKSSESRALICLQQRQPPAMQAEKEKL